MSARDELHVTALAEWFERCTLWWRITVSMYAVSVTIGPADVVELELVAEVVEE